MNQVQLSGANGSAAVTMTSREIAELTGKNHADVMRDIRSMVDQLTKAEMLSCAKSTTYIGKDGRSYPQYELDRDTCLNLLLGYDPVARMKVIKRWQELESSAAAPALLKDPEVARLVAMRDAGLLSAADAVAASFRLLGLRPPRAIAAPQPPKPPVVRSKPAPAPLPRVISTRHIPDGVSLILSEMASYAMVLESELLRCMVARKLCDATGKPLVAARGYYEKSRGRVHWHVKMLMDRLASLA